MPKECFSLIHIIHTLFYTNLTWMAGNAYNCQPYDRDTTGQWVIGVTPTTDLTAAKSRHLKEFQSVHLYSFERGFTGRCHSCTAPRTYLSVYICDTLSPLRDLPPKGMSAAEASSALPVQAITVNTLLPCLPTLSLHYLSILVIHSTGSPPDIPSLSPVLIYSLLKGCTTPLTSKIKRGAMGPSHLRDAGSLRLCLASIMGRNLLQYESIKAAAQCVFRRPN